jgi:hypothetical protein
MGKASIELTTVVVVTIIGGIIFLALAVMFGENIVELLGGLFEGMTRSIQSALCGMLGGAGKMIFGGIC